MSSCIRCVSTAAGDTLVLATEWGLPQWLTSARMLRGWALTEQNQAEEGIAQIPQGIAAHQAIGVKPPTGLVLLAAAYGKVGQPQEGLQAVAAGLEVVVQNGEHWCETELYRLQGELLLQQAGPCTPRQAKDHGHAGAESSKQKRVCGGL